MEKIKLEEICENDFIGVVSKTESKFLIKENKVLGGFSGYTLEEILLTDFQKIKKTHEKKWTSPTKLDYIKDFKKFQKTARFFICKSEENIKLWINEKD